jgi:hypothetical protein
LDRRCFQTVVTVEVGAEKKAFSVHKDLLIFYSDYFRGAFNGSFSEAASGKISLVDESGDVFDVINRFIYTRQLSDDIESDLEFEMLIKAWLFGDKYLMPSLQNRVMSVLIEKIAKNDELPTPHLELIYNNTLPGSPLRKLLVDYTAYEGDMEDVVASDGGERWPHEALVDLVVVMGAMREEGIGIYLLPHAHQHRCYYHIHPDGENCDSKL